MTAKTNKHTLVMTAGLIWGLAGFTVEILPNSSDFVQMAFRLSFIFTSSLILLSTLEMKINKTFQFSLLLLYSYLIIFIFTILIHTIDINSFLREIILILVATLICVILSNKETLLDFIRGIYFSLVFLTVFYFSHIDFAQVVTPFYRLIVALNANGIAATGLTTFVLSYFYIVIDTQKTSTLFSARNLHIIIAILSFFVVIATKSRTSLGTMILAFLVISFFYKKRKTLISFFVIGFIIFILNYEVFEAVLRLKNSDTYGGDASLTNLTGRTTLWAHAWHLIENNILLGVGPADAYITFENHKGNFHNAYIQTLVTVGLIGSIPVFLLVLIALKNSLLHSSNFLFKALFLIGLLPSFVEAKLLNYGSPGGFLFFIALLYLAGNTNNLSGKTK